jgi:hypothetical protein
MARKPPKDTLKNEGLSGFQDQDVISRWLEVFFQFGLSRFRRNTVYNVFM